MDENHSEPGGMAQVDSPTDRHLPQPSEGPHEELRSLAERIATLKRRRDELREIAELEDEVRTMEHLLNPSEQVAHTPTIATPSLEGFDERPARRRRVDSDSLPIAGRGPKIEKIPIFEGKGMREYYDFESRLRIAFRLDPAAFVLEDQKIAYTLQYLQPTFRQLWIQREMEDDGETLGWSEMMSFLLDQIKSPVNRELQVTIVYQKSTQKDGQSVNDFAAYLSTLENQINPPYEQKHLVMHLYSKLRPELRAALSNFPEFPTTRRELVERAATLEDNLRRTSSTPSLPRRDKAARSSSSSTRSFTSYTRKPAPNRSDTNKDPAACFHCGIKGHWAKDCRKKAEGRPPITGSNAIQAKK
jgi:hypothetical protein